MQNEYILTMILCTVNGEQRKKTESHIKRNSKTEKNQIRRTETIKRNVCLQQMKRELNSFCLSVSLYRWFRPFNLNLCT